MRLTLARFNLSPPTGVLLYGPPGTGKTLMAKATALTLTTTGGGGGAFLAIRVSDVVRSGVGDSERIVTSLFEEARRNAPSVVFIDEFEALFSKRDGMGGSGSGRLASTLLQCMDDVTRWRDADLQVISGVDDGDVSSHSNNSSRVVVLGATNSPWNIDEAFLRAGRFDRVVYVGLPDVKDREAIMRVHVGRMTISKAKCKTKEAVIDNICKEMARETDGFSGADLAGLCRAAAVRCLNEGSNDVIGGSSCGSEKGTSTLMEGVRQDHFKLAREDDMTMGSNSAEAIDRLKRWKR